LQSSLTLTVYPQELQKIRGLQAEFIRYNGRCTLNPLRRLPFARFHPITVYIAARGLNGIVSRVAPECCTDIGTCLSILPRICGARPCSDRAMSRMWQKGNRPMSRRICLWLALALWFSALATWGGAARPLAAAPLVAPDPPDEIRCRPEGVATDQVRIEWGDTNAGASSYELYRVEAGENNWALLTTVLGASCADELCQFVDTGASNSVVYRYRVRANDGNDTSAYSAICREPLSTEDSAGNFRGFYRLVDCPDIDGKQACTQDINSGGQNIHLTDIFATHNAYRQEYLDLGFKDFAVYGGGKPFPIDMYPCNNGCANSAGIQIPPGNVEGANYDPNTGTGSSYETFVVGHEGFHKIQGRYGAVIDPWYKWLIEGQARSGEDKVCIYNAAQCIFWDDQVDKYYVGATQSYLGFPEQGLLDASYNAALFWTYVTEQFATTFVEPSYGIDVLVRFWQQNEVNDGAAASKDGMGTLDDMLATAGSSRRFKDIFQDFAVANYAKDLLTNPVPNDLKKYNYVDEETFPGGTYNTVKRTVSSNLLPDNAILGTTSLQAWGSRYFEVFPDPALSDVHVEVEALLGSYHSMYYHVLAIKNGAIVDQWSDSGPTFDLSVANGPDYDRLVLVVASMENAVNFNYGFNLSDGIFIVNPTAALPAAVGEATAPEKFILQVRVLDEAGNGVAGVDTGQFTVTIGSTVIVTPGVPSGALIGSSYIGGQYWITLRAPANPGCTTCDLKVAYGAYSDLEMDAILYGPKPDVDNMIVIDRSFSMAGAKIGIAQEAARVYVDSYDTGDRMGVVSYNDAPTSEYGLTGWTNTTRIDAQNAIDGIDPPAGNTATGAALREGNSLLAAQASPNPAWTIVLLSDGTDTVDDTNDHIPAYISEYKQAVKDGDQVPVIHVVAVGDDADGVELSRLTNESGGLFQFLPESGFAAAASSDPNAVPTAADLAANAAAKLAAIYRVFAEEVRDEQQVFVNFFPTVSQPVVSRIQVEKGVSEGVFLLKYSPVNATLPFIRLQKPGAAAGEFIAPTLVSPGHLLWRVPGPVDGEWTLLVRGCTTCPSQYLVEAALISDLTLSVYLGLPVEERIVGKPMPLIAFLADVAPLAGATVTALSERTGEQITLFDDGLHGDGAAGDGAYGGILVNTNQPGGYTVVVEAKGTSPFAGPYTRRKSVAFYLPDGPDDDKDRMPTWWEIENGTDPTKPDNDLDPDGDGLTHGQEYTHKTNPFDPDTDDGGENDGSEVGRSADPLFPGDDGTKPPTFRPWPGPKLAILRLVVAASVKEITIERALSPTGTFTVVANKIVPTVEWRDPNVENDQPYCYRIISEGRTRATSPILCTTPKSDPHPPHGTVEPLFPPGAKVPRALMLLLNGEDNPNTEEHPAFDGAFLGLGAIQSGVKEMMLSNRADFEGAMWESYQPQKWWELAPRSDGLATVFVRFRDHAGNVSDVVAASFVVDPTLVPTLPLYLPNIAR
jgi:hypothetical protein